MNDSAQILKYLETINNNIKWVFGVSVLIAYMIMIKKCKK